jgi:hypothetical protein
MNAREEFVEKNMDEMTGLLLSAFRFTDKFGNPDEEGRFLRRTMARARNLLGRLYDEMFDSINIEALVAERQQAKEAETVSAAVRVEYIAKIEKAPDTATCTQIGTMLKTEKRLTTLDYDAVKAAGATKRKSFEPQPNGVKL